MILVIVAALMLGGCNLVVSRTPLYRAADAAGAPQMKAGLWASPDANCTFDPAQPFDKWPGCANGAMIGPDFIVATVSAPGLTTDQPTAAAAPKKVNLPYLLAAGDPRVMQVDMRLPELGKLGFIYFVAIHPIAFDSGGRITAAEAWPVQCGPPPPKTETPTEKDPTKGFVTDRPLPGLKLENGECTPVGKAAVANAAEASRAWADQVGQMHWVRAGER